MMQITGDCLHGISVQFEPFKSIAIYSLSALVVDSITIILDIYFEYNVTHL